MNACKLMPVHMMHTTIEKRVNLDRPLAFEGALYSRSSESEAEVGDSSDLRSSVGESKDMMAREQNASRQPTEIVFSCKE